MTTTTLPQKVESLPEIADGEVCTHCGVELCQRQIVFNLALGYEEAYSCISCLAKEKKQPAQELFNYLLGYIQTRPCYMIMWEKSRCSETLRAGCEFRSSCVE